MNNIWWPSDECEKPLLPRNPLATAAKGDAFGGCVKLEGSERRLLRPAGLACRVVCYAVSRAREYHAMDATNYEFPNSDSAERMC